MQRIAILVQVQARQRTPGAADCVEGLASADGQPLDIAERLFRDLLRLGDLPIRIFLQADAAERQGLAAADLVVLDLDELETAAAEVADDAVRPPDAGHDAVRGKTRLVAARQQPHRRAANRFDRRQELLAIGGIAGRGGGKDVQVGNADLVAQAAEPHQRPARLVRRLVRQAARCADATPEAGKHLFVEQHRRGARVSFVDDEADRVRSDIDHGNRSAAVETAADQFMLWAVSHASSAPQTVSGYGCAATCRGRRATDLS